MIKFQIKIIVIGSSKGGLAALKTVLSALPAEFSLPVVVVQHREKGSDDSLVQLLQKVSALPVVDVEDKQLILPGKVYLAPADYHLLVESDHFTLSVAEPVNYSRPSVDVLFESAAESYGEGVIAVILTGTNQDGAKGLNVIKQAGGMTIVQDPDTAEADKMPRAALAATTNVDKILPLEEIGLFLGKIRQPE